MSQIHSVAIVGSGPAGLMAAVHLAQAGVRVTLFEKRKAIARKLLIAGSSGLNITNTIAIDEFAASYSGPLPWWRSLLADFSPAAWIAFIEGLGQETFVGTSGRVFVREMKASKLLKAWTQRLTELGAEWVHDQEWDGLSRVAGSDRIRVSFVGGLSREFDAVCLALGGGSYEPDEYPLRWPNWFKQQGIRFHEFSASNVGYEVDWSAALLKEAEGLPLKNIEFTSSKGTKKGDLVITQYGLEGTPIYTLAEVGECRLDLKPDLDHRQIVEKLVAVRENWSPIRRLNKQLGLAPAARALVFHHAPRGALETIESLAACLKRFPIKLLRPRSLAEAISSRGGIDLDEVNADLMLKQFPGVFVAGEMLDWDAPTGGWLIQGCVSQGARAARGILGYFRQD